MAKKRKTKVKARTKPNGKKTGRPLIDIDVSQLEEMLSIGCTQEECAQLLGCSVDTLSNRYSDVLKTGKQQFKASLRRRQFEASEVGTPGSTTMLIWLGKNHLGQSDKMAQEIHQTNEIGVDDLLGKKITIERVIVDKTGGEDDPS